MKWKKRIGMLVLSLATVASTFMGTAVCAYATSGMVQITSSDNIRSFLCILIGFVFLAVSAKLSVVILEMYKNKKAVKDMSK